MSSGNWLVLVLFVWVLAVDDNGEFWVFGGVDRRMREVKSVFLI